VRLLFLLLAGHFLCDYPLQGDFIGRFKNRHTPSNMNPPIIPWWHLMTAHSFIQAGAVLLITNNIFLAGFELVAHFIIDVLKCEGKTDINEDQIFHILCKLGYVIYLGGIKIG
jgi:hypothetical protein